MSDRDEKKAPAKKTSARRAAARKKAPKEEKAEPAAEVTAARADPGPAPTPVVLARHDREMKERDARGYSLGELESAGVGVLFARRNDVRVDSKRRSVLERNVSSLRGWYVPEPKTRKAEEAREEKEKKKKVSRPKKARKSKED